MEFKVKFMKLLRILHQDDSLVAVQKPAGMHVHPPEDPRHRISRDQNCMKLLRSQLDLPVHPVHRLDRATSGVLLFALNPEAASALGRQFQDRTVRKTYLSVARGHLPESLRLDRALKDTGEATTEIRRIGLAEFPWRNERFSTSRYSLVFAHPLTGRMHQIRRHLAGAGHPIVGDTVYGDGEHNRLFRQFFDIQQLWLHAHSLEFRHPTSGEMLRVRARFPSSWHPLFDAFGICPWQGPSGQSSSEN
jgi:tRNA pseudouridine65 synthase